MYTRFLITASKLFQSQYIIYKLLLINYLFLQCIIINCYKLSTELSHCILNEYMQQNLIIEVLC